MKTLRTIPLAIAMMLTLATASVHASASDNIRQLAATSSRVAQHDSPYDERNWLNRFYGPRDFAPVWTGPARSQAAIAISLLQDADEHGLSSADYDADALAARLRSEPPSDSLDVALTQAMLHYLADLRVGRVRSEYHTALPDPRLLSFDPVEQLRLALAGNRLATAVEAAQPRIPLYQSVRKMLAHYRDLAKQPFTPLPALAAKKKVEAGADYAAARALHERLQQLGDMDADAPAPGQRYTSALAAGVKRFQARHGLASDGVLGPGTIAALNVPLATRVRQLELALERLRWLPDFTAGPMIAVNLPTFRLWALELGVPKAPPPLEMRVIVGTAVKHQTPLFIGSLRYVEFNPYWNVPRSIERAEILPKMAKDSSYLVKNDMELVPLGAAGRLTQTVDAATMQGLREGKYRVRQRPGPNNALGAVKFAMPNADNIYLHSTSARELFKLTRRDLSHGCIRVEDPLALAKFALAKHPDWTPAEVETAMAPAPMKIVNLKTPIPVVLFYSTAITDQHDKALFAPDIYQRDPALEQALLGRHGKDTVKR